MKLNILTLFFLMMFSLSVLAEVKNTPEAVPSNLHVYNVEGHTYVDHIVDTCTSQRYHIDPNHAKYDTVVSILLAAQIAKKKVILRYDGCVNGTQGEVVGVYLKE